MSQAVRRPLSRDGVDAGTAGEGSQPHLLLLTQLAVLAVLAECWAGRKDACLTLLSYIHHLLCGK